MRVKVIIFLVLTVILFSILAYSNSKSVSNKGLPDFITSKKIDKRQELSNISNTINFNPNSYQISKDSEIILDSLNKRFNRFEEFYKGKYKYYLITLKTINCKKERKVDPFIGVKRAKVIKDYMVQRYNRNESAIHIIEDTDSLTVMGSCNTGCVEINGIVYQ